MNMKVIKWEFLRELIRKDERKVQKLVNNY